MFAARNVALLVLLLLEVVLLSGVLGDSPPSNDMVCHDPDAGGTTQNNDRRFLIIGSEHSKGAGFGNLLIFFPAAYYFATFTGRDIVIQDNSIVGEVCTIIKCGFPFVSEMALAYPGILTPENVRDAPDIKKGEMMKHFEGAPINDLVVRGWGYKPESEWWNYFVPLVDCVSKMTGCDKGDVSCADRHAFQRLIRGPFRTELTEKEEARIEGVPDNVKHAIMALPHAFAPRIDAAIHIRRQFNHFESQEDANGDAAKKEVKEWIEGEEGKAVFKEIEEKLLQEIAADRLHRGNLTAHHGVQSAVSGTKDKADPIYVYLAADNEDIKEHFVKLLEQKHTGSVESGGDVGGDGQQQHLEIRVMRVRTAGIFHVKDLNKFKEKNQDGLLDMVFDWYALSLANVVLAWRKGGTHLISTFVQSASRMSGTTKRTSYDRDFGEGGVGTIGNLLQNKRGKLAWDKFWIYGFLEDYKKAEERLRGRRLATSTSSRGRRLQQQQHHHHHHLQQTYRSLTKHMEYTQDEMIRDMFTSYNCQHVYFDMGTNIGVQIRKIYEPKLYANSPVLPFFNKYFGKDRHCNTCTIGFEPNSLHKQRLQDLQKFYNENKIGVVIFNAAVGTQTSTAEFSTTNATVDENFDWGGTITKHSQQSNMTNHQVVNVIDVGRIIKLVKSLLPSQGKLVAKSDIEGYEFELFPHLILDGEFCLFDFIFTEWHSHLFTNKTSLQSRYTNGVKNTVMRYFNETAPGKGGCATKLSVLDDETYHKDRQPLSTFETCGS